MSENDPEDDALDDVTELDEDDLCEHGIPWDECDDCAEDEEELCPHGYTEDEECPTCDGDDGDLLDDGDTEDIDEDEAENEGPEP